MCDYSKFSADSFARDLFEVDWDRVIANGASCADKYTKIAIKHAPFKRKQSSCLNLGSPLELRHQCLQLKLNCMHQVMTLGTNTIGTKFAA